jgi:ADP-heptose:LPS heptosyltransferase
VPAAATARRWMRDPALLAWAAPVRSLRWLCGWQPRPVPLSEARSILVIRPDEIGDVVLTSPFLRELRRVAPRARITLLVKPGCYGLVELCPYVDAVHPFEFGSGGRLPWRVWKIRYRELPRRGFDLVLLPRYDTDWYNSELVAHLLAGSGGILAHRRKADLGGRWQAPACRFFSNPRIEHEAEHPLSFLLWCGAGDIASTHLELWLDREDDAFAARLLSGPGLYVAFAAGARDWPRRWPADRFAELARWLRERLGLIPVSLGARGDPRLDGIDMVGRTTLRQAAAVMKRCALFVGNDSGLMHVAAAVGTPVVEISAFRAGGNPGHHNSPCRFRPWGVPHRVVQPAAGTEVLAIDEVAVEAVQAACADLLKQAQGNALTPECTI